MNEIKTAEKIDLRNLKITIDDTIKILTAINENKNLKRVCISSHQISDLSKTIDLNNPPIDFQPFYHAHIISAVIANPAFISIEISNQKHPEKSEIIDKIKEILVQKRKLIESNKNLVEFNQAYLSGNTDICVKTYPLVKNIQKQFMEFFNSFAELVKEMHDEVFKLARNEIGELMARFAFSGQYSTENLKKIVDGRNRELSRKGLNIEGFDKLNSTMERSEKIASVFDFSQIKTFSDFMTFENVSISHLDKISASHIAYLNEQKIGQLKSIKIVNIPSNEVMSILLTAVQSQKGPLQTINLQSGDYDLISFTHEELVVKNIRLKWVVDNLEPQLLENIKSIKIKNCSGLEHFADFLKQAPKLKKFYLQNNDNKIIIDLDTDELILKNVNLDNIGDLLTLPQFKNIKKLEIVNCFTRSDKDITSLFNQFNGLEKLTVRANENENTWGWIGRKTLANLAATLIEKNQNLTSLNLGFCNDYGFFITPDHRLKKEPLGKIFKAISQHRRLQNLDFSDTPLTKKEKSSLIAMATSGFVPLTDVEFRDVKPAELKILLDRNKSILNGVRLKTRDIIRDDVIGKLRVEVDSPFWNRRTILLSFVTLGIYIGIRAYQRYKTNEQLKKLEVEQEASNPINPRAPLANKDMATGYKDEDKAENRQVFGGPTSASNRLLGRNYSAQQKQNSDQKEEQQASNSPNMF